jgi:hypothetical protein
MTEHPRLPSPHTASAAARPCELYADHGSATPSVTEGHHRHPVYLQNRVYGQIRDPQLLWLCSTCHDNVHAWLYWLLGERRSPDPLPPVRARGEARAAFAWYTETLRSSVSS